MKDLEEFCTACSYNADREIRISLDVLFSVLLLLHRVCCCNVLKDLPLKHQNFQTNFKLSLSSSKE